MNVSEIIEKKPLPMIANMRRGKYTGYSLVLSSEGEMELVLGDYIEHEEFCISDNQILIDALNIGEQLADISFQRMSKKERPEETPENIWSLFVARPWYCAEQIPLLKKWIAEYGFIPIIDINAPNKEYCNNLSMELMSLYDSFCQYLKGMYEYDVLPNHYVSLKTIEECREHFFQKAHKSYIFRFIGDKLGTIYQPISLPDLLNDMLFDLVSTFDAEYKPFLCRICNKQSFKRNPKQCYCSSCQKLRYQVSREKKRKGVK